MRKKSRPEANRSRRTAGGTSKLLGDVRPAKELEAYFLPARREARNLIFAKGATERSASDGVEVDKRRRLVCFIHTVPASFVVCQPHFTRPNVGRREAKEQHKRENLAELR